MDEFLKPGKTRGKAYETLAAWIGGQCLPHAVLAEGPDERANAAFAMSVAKAAMCTGEVSPAEKPCGLCRDCIKLEKGVHPDLLVYEGEGKARSFHIETVREIRSRAFIYPNEAPVKAFILKNAQDMTDQAQNALLKILEEPPKSVIFILTCENKSKLLETVLSRVASVWLDAGNGDETDFSADNNSDKRGAPGKTDAAAEIGALAARLLLASNELDALAELSRYERDRAGFIEALSHMRGVFESLLLPGRAAEAAGDTSVIPPLRLLRIIDIMDEISLSASGNGNIALLSCVLCARIRALK